MLVKDEIINVEITYDELSKLIMPHLFNAGFQIEEVNETEFKIQLNESGEIITRNGIIIKFKRSRK